MARVTIGCALAHSPLMNEAPAQASDADLIAAYKGATSRAGASIRATSPDVAIVFGQDHFRSHFYDLMPAFTIGTGAVSGWGDWGTREGPLPTYTALARSLHRGLLGRGFDVACSYDLLVDHGVTQVLDLLELPDDLPLIPILINTSASPLPTPGRCRALGEAIAGILAEYPEDLKVLAIGSGGISHRPPTDNVESEDPSDADRVRKLIHGRDAVRANEAARRQGLIAAVAGGKFKDSINPDWDRKILDIFAAGQAGQFAAASSEDSIELEGGSGGQEIRTWLATSALCGDKPAREICYYPIPSLITGMGGVVFA